MNINERVNSGEISQEATSSQTNQELLKTVEFTLIPSNAKAKYLFFTAPYGFPFSLIYPKDWVKKSYKIKFVEENTWADQYNTNHKTWILLSCQFKAIYKNECGTVIEKKTADLLRHPSDNKFEHLAKIKLRQSTRENVDHYTLIPINQKPKSTLIQHILNRKIPVKIINQVANLFFRIIAYHQGQILDQTNWLEVPARRKSRSKISTQIPMDLIKNETEKQAQMTRKKWEEQVQNCLKEIDLIFEKYPMNNLNK